MTKIGNDLVTREELVRLANEKGIPITERTVRYWEELGLLPHAERSGKSVFHDISRLQDIAIIYRLKYDTALVLKRYKHKLVKILGEDIYEGMEEASES